jgi:hypothetical protein
VFLLVDAFGSIAAASGLVNRKQDIAIVSLAKFFLELIHVPQLPLLASDHPLLALLKKYDLEFPEIHAETQHRLAARFANIIQAFLAQVFSRPLPATKIKQRFFGFFQQISYSETEEAVSPDFDLGGLPKGRPPFIVEAFEGFDLSLPVFGNHPPQTTAKDALNQIIVFCIGIVYI